MRFFSGREPTLDVDELRNVPVKARSTLATRSFERLVAATARRDRDAREAEVRRLNVYAEAWDGSDGSKALQVDGDKCAEWVRQIITAGDLFSDVATWTGHLDPSDGGFTDIQSSGSSEDRTYSIEVKAQLTKNGLGEITQADYLTGYSDFLARYLESEAKFHRSLERRFPNHLAQLGYRGGPTRDWTLNDCLLAEIAGLYDAAHLRAAGVSEPHELRDFVERHYLLHVVGPITSGRAQSGGARLIRLADVPFVQRLVLDEFPNAQLKDNPKASRVSFAHSARVAYTIHVGYSLRVVSKSKIHVGFLDGAGMIHVE